MKKKQEIAAPWKQWLDTATRGLKNHPDWGLARQELLDHLEDKTADLERIFPGMTHEEAQELALSRMGDPEEIGAALARAHSKVLGALYWIFQGMIGFTGLVMILVLPLYLWFVVLPLAVPNWPF